MLIKKLGHLLLGSVCIYGGFNVLKAPDHVAGVVEGMGLPYPRQLTILNGAIMLVAGSMLSLNILPKLSALVLASTLPATTVVGHAFWKEKDPKARSAQIVHFYKNLSTLGGFLLVMAEK
jgi:uncharacterized membrane protein YphA (DoxX/SURF4 family)